MSPGSVKFGSVDRCRLCARPMPDSSMPPCHTGHARARRRHRAPRIDSAWPPTRPGLMLMMRHAPRVDGHRRARRARGSTRPGRSASGAALQRGVIRQVVVVERLLDHHQVERVERAPVRRRPPACRRRWRRPSAGSRRTARAGARPASTSQPGLILILMRWYPAARSTATRSTSSSSESWMPIDTPDAIGRPLPPSACQSGTPALPRVQVPRRHLDGGLRHAVAAHARQRAATPPRMGEVAPEHARREKLDEDVPGRLGVSPL